MSYQYAQDWCPRDLSEDLAIVRQAKAVHSACYETVRLIGDGLHHRPKEECRGWMNAALGFACGEADRHLGFALEGFQKSLLAGGEPAVVALEQALPDAIKALRGIEILVNARMQLGLGKKLEHDLEEQVLAALAEATNP